MDKIIANSVGHQLADYDVKKIAPNARILLYKDLLEYDNIIDAIGKTGQLILLFPTHKDKDNIGHWIAILWKPEIKTIEYFDSYGLSPQAEIGYSDNQNVKQKILNKMISNFMLEGGRFQWNNTRLQVMKNGNDDCGRYASLRCRFYYLTNEEFCKMFKGQKMSPDWLVCALTFICVRDDVLDQKAIKQMLK